MSRSIGRLEEELGQPLFERQTRSVTLTDSGSLLLDRARQILLLVEDTQAQFADDGQTGRIRVAAIPTIAPYFLPGLLKNFHRKFPSSSVIVHEDTTENLLRRLNDGLVDVVIAALPIDAKYLPWSGANGRCLTCMRAKLPSKSKPPETFRLSDIRCNERLAELLKSYRRKAA